jgi:hypothetical protein
MMVNKGETEELGENPAPVTVVHYESHLTSFGTKFGSLRLVASSNFRSYGTALLQTNPLKTYLYE